MSKFNFMGREYTLPQPKELTLTIDALSAMVSDVIEPDRGFVESVRRFGVVMPVVLVEEAGAMRVVDGRRRIAAARKAGIHSVRCLVYNGCEDAPADMIVVALNEQRSDNPLADFNAIRRLQERGATEREISQATGMPIARIRRRMKLATLIPEIFAALGEGRISVTVAEACAALGAVYQRALAQTLREKGKLTLADVHGVKVARRAEALTAAPALAELLAAPLDIAEAQQTEAARPDSLTEVLAVLSPDTLSRIRADLIAADRPDLNSALRAVNAAMAERIASASFATDRVR